jgi:peroxiredoxin
VLKQAATSAVDRGIEQTIYTLWEAAPSLDRTQHSSGKNYYACVRGTAGGCLAAGTAVPKIPDLLISSSGCAGAGLTSGLVANSTGNEMTAPRGAWSKHATDIVKFRLFGKQLTVLQGTRLACCVLSLIILATSPICAAPPAVGERAPDFQLLNVEGKTVRLSTLTEQGQVVLIVLRGYPGYQCPYCNRQVQDFLQKAAAFAAAGVHVVMVYPGPSQDLDRRAKEFLVRKSLPANFDLLLDPGYDFTNRYGLRWDAPNETAYPSSFVLDRNGLVLFSKTVQSHGGRVTAQEILDALPKSKSVR